MKSYWSWNRSWTYTNPGTDTKSYSPRNWYRIHIGPVIDHQPTSALELVPNPCIYFNFKILKPYQSQNWCWSHIGPGTNHQSILLLELIPNQYRFWSQSWTRIEHEPITELHTKFQQWSSNWNWSHSGTSDEPVLVPKTIQCLFPSSY